MELFDCAIGQRVYHKETGKPATIKRLARAKGEVEIEFDNGLTERVNPKMLEPSGGGDLSAMRAKHPCPQCGADMGEELTCSQCNFAYRLTQPRRGLPIMFTLLIGVLVVAAVAFVAWKFVLHEKLP